MNWNKLHVEKSLKLNSINKNSAHQKKKKIFKRKACRLTGKQYYLTHWKTFSSREIHAFGDHPVSIPIQTRIIWFSPWTFHSWQAFTAPGAGGTNSFSNIRQVKLFHRGWVSTTTVPTKHQSPHFLKITPPHPYTQCWNDRPMENIFSSEKS